MIDNRRYQLLQTKTYVTQFTGENQLFEYEMVLGVKDQQTASDQHIVAIHNPNNPDDYAMMNNFSSITFSDGQMLGKFNTFDTITVYLI